MKVMLVNGSPHAEGCTYTALREVEKTLLDCGMETEMLGLGNDPVRDCIACHACGESRRCAFDDVANEIIDRAADCAGFVFGTPVYYAHPSGRVLSILNRVFFAGGRNFVHKPGAAICSARRGGTTATFDVMNKYFTISQMPVVGSSYWNAVHGNTPAEVLQDAEGLQTMRNLGRNMAWLIQCIDRSGIPAPKGEFGNWTSFIR